jgi:hypothetical protein
VRSLSVVKFDHNDDVLPHEGLTLEGLKLIEMLTTFVSIETQKQEISTPLQSILYTFFLEGLYKDTDSKPAFFLSTKSQTEIDSTLLNYHVF